jgi:hypothetical protein
VIRSEILQKAIDTEIKLALESKPIGEVRVLQERARLQVEDKKRELRLLVANRYRDLIESADSIVRMRTASASLLGNVERVLLLLDADAINTTGGSSTTITSSEKHYADSRRLLSVGRSMKRLLDSHDRVWAALASSRFVDASHLVREALALAAQLPCTPLVASQQRLLSRFPARILAHARDAIQQHAGGAPADAVCALVLVGDCSVGAAFGEFLELRERALAGMLRLRQNDDEVAKVLAHAAALVRETLRHVDELFVQRASLVYERLATEPLASDDVRAACDRWLATAATTMAAETAVVLKRVTRLAGLADVMRATEQWELLLAAPLFDRAREIATAHIDALPLEALLRNGAMRLKADAAPPLWETDDDDDGSGAANDEQLALQSVERALRRLLDDAAVLAAVEAKRSAQVWQLVRSAAAAALQRCVESDDGAVTTVLREVPTGALFVGRVCQLLAQRSRVLRELFGDGSELHASLVRALRTRMLAAHWRWINDVAERLARDEFGAALRADGAALPDGGARRRASWQPVAGGSSDAVIPSQPSTAVFALLVAACDAVQRAGGHMVDSAVRRRLARRLASVALETLAADCDAAAGANKESAVQRLLDLHYFGDTLVGASLSDACDDDGTAAAAAALVGSSLALPAAPPVRTDALRALISRVEARLDPIDLAFYEPLVRTQARLCYRRTAVLFGAFTQLAPIQGDEAQPQQQQQQQQQQQHNTLMLAPTLTRFARLPVTVEEDDDRDDDEEETEREANLDGRLDELLRQWTSSTAAGGARRTAGSSGTGAAAVPAAPAQGATQGMLKSLFQF